MAAKPIERFVKKQIQEQGGWDRILERIASGETVADIARTIKRPDGQPISRNFVSTLLHQDPIRSAKVLKARDEGSDALVDDALHVVKSAPNDKDAIQHARVEADIKLKVAGLINRERWGEKQQQVNVQVNVGDLHLDALRHGELPVQQPIASLPSLTSADSTPHAPETTVETAA